jgi:hypothetical protein
MSKDKPRFKIDHSGMSSIPFGLFVRRLEPVMCFGLFAPHESWGLLSIFETREEALAAYDKVKNLPEYLD